MTCSRKIVLVLIALFLVAALLPQTHERIDWMWAHGKKHSDGYLNYLGKWPDGSHAERAKFELSKAQAHEAMAAEIVQDEKEFALSTRVTKTRAQTKHELALKQDEFYWHRATTDNTVADYNLYLEHFPAGKHAAEARQKLATPGLPSGE